MNFESRPTHSLRPYPGNARTHSPKQIKQISRSIERFGFNNPVLVDDDDQIIAGHGRVEAAKLLNMKTVPTVRLSHLSEAEKRAYILADNRLAEKAGWDNEVLAIELQGLVDLGFDVLLTGFEPAEVDIIFEGIGDESEQPENRVPDERAVLISAAWAMSGCLASMSWCAEIRRRETMASKHGSPSCTLLPVRNVNGHAKCI